MAKTTKYAPTKRTGLRKPVEFLKAWADRQYTRRLTPRLRVAMVDEALDTNIQEARKSWYLALTQDRDLLKELGPVRGLPKAGSSLLLFEDDVVALVEYALERLVTFDDDDRVVNADVFEAELVRHLMPQSSKRKSAGVKKTAAKKRR